MELPILFGAPSGVCAETVADLLARDFPVAHAADLAAARNECRRGVPAAVVLTLAGDADTEDVLSFLREQGRRTAVFVVTEGPLGWEDATQILAAGARGVLDGDAPNFTDDLVRRLTRLLRERRVRQVEDKALVRLFARHDVIGHSPAMRDVFRRALKANRFQNLPVLIEGEKGTPKHRLAAAILYLDSARIRRPFFALSCMGLGRVLGNPPGQADAAAEQWRQLLRAAHGGTLFLDDIGGLERELQPILLAAARRPAELRVITATEQPLDELVGQGILDEALAEWLGVFRIPLPSLRGRPEDIAAQARHALRTFCPGADFGPEVLEALQRLPWEGNTMELEAVLRESLLGKKDGTTLRLADLPQWIAAASREAEMPQPVPHPGDWSDGLDPVDVTAENYERRLLRNLLESKEAGAVRPDHVCPN